MTCCRCPRIGRRWRLAALLLLLGVAGCASAGDTDNPVARKFSWFDFLNGGEMRRTCGAGGPDRMRFVYNAHYQDQVRIYEAVLPAVPSRSQAEPLLEVRVIRQANLAQLRVGRLSDLLEPWRGTTAQVVLRPQDAELLRRTVRDAGVYGPAPEGLRLNDYDFFWVVNACVDGQFHFNAYKWPSQRFEAADFGDLLLAWDPTGIAPPEPRDIPPNQRYEGVHPGTTEFQARGFQLEVGRNGLVGVSPVFGPAGS